MTLPLLNFVLATAGFIDAWCLTTYVMESCKPQLHPMYQQKVITLQSSLWFCVAAGLLMLFIRVWQCKQWSAVNLSLYPLASGLRENSSTIFTITTVQLLLARIYMCQYQLWSHSQPLLPNAHAICNNWACVGERAWDWGYIRYIPSVIIITYHTF